MMPGFPGKIDPRMMQQAMKRMGVEEKEIPNVQEVIIRCADKDIVIAPAAVSKVKMMGNESWQITGNATEKARDTKPTISEEDVETVMEQTGADADTAREAIAAANGDLAVAIMELSKKEE